jgi:outer membrane lipoprotein-sorting protein
MINAQSLQEIVKNYTTANKLDQAANKKSIKITAKMSMMGMEMPMEIWMKNPNKIKTVMDMSGQKMIQAYDGEKGYTINPMTGSTQPVEMGPEEVKQLLRNNNFENMLDKYLKNGQLELAGEETVNGKPTIKVKATIEPGTVSYLYIDKANWLLIKQTMDVTQGGMPATVETYPSDYKEINGLIMPMKTTTSVSGMEMVINFTNVEVDIPMEDSIFKLK